MRVHIRYNKGIHGSEYESIDNVQDVDLQRDNWLVISYDDNKIKHFNIIHLLWYAIEKF